MGGWDARVGAAAAPSHGDPPASPYRGPSRIGPYPILGRIAKGGMGDVYRAHDEHDGKPVAVKLLTSLGSQQLTRFQREAKVIAQLNHRSIVRIYDTGEDEYPWIAMELVMGDTLDIAFRDDPLSPPWWKRLKSAARQILEALAAMHEAGIVHRDIKPGNVMVDKEGRVKIVDFGLAHVSDASVNLTMGHVIGSYAYMAPEQGSGRRVDARTDLYSLGVVLYELLAGQPPYRADNLVALLVKVFSERPQPLSEVNSRIPAPWERYVSRLLSKEPEKRFQSAREAIEDLNELPPKDEAMVPAAAAPSLGALQDADLTSTMQIGLAPTLAGRSHHVELLERAVADAAGGSGSLVVVAGEPGSGKTRLLDELRIIGWRHRGIQLRVAPRPGQGIRVFALTLRDAAYELERSGVAGHEQMAARARSLAEAVNQEISSARVEELRAFLLELARERLTVIVADDADLSGGGVPELLAHLGEDAARGAASAPGGVLTRMLVVAATRFPLVETFLGDEPDVRIVHVTPLDLGGIRAWLQSAFPGLPHLEALAVRMAAASAGNPAVLQVISRELVRRRVLTPVTFGWRFSPSLLANVSDPEAAVACLDLPDPLDALSSQISVLEPRLQDLLARVVRQDGEFHPDSVRGDFDESELHDAVQTLTREGLLADAASGWIQRPPALLRTAMMKPALQEQAASASGRHRKAGKPAMPAPVAEGWRALRENDLSAALVAADAARDAAQQAGSAGDEAAAMVLQGEALRLLGKRRKAGAALRDAYTLAYQAGGGTAQAAWALLGLARLSTEDGFTSRALQCAEKAGNLFRDARDAPGCAEARLEKGRAYLKMAHGPSAGKAFARAAALAQLASDARAHGRALNGLGRTLHMQGDLDGAIAAFAEAFDVAGRETDVAAALHVARARVLAERGVQKDATEALQRARSLTGERVPPPLAAELLTVEASLGPQGEDACSRASQALELARSCERLDLECEALLVLLGVSGSRDASLGQLALKTSQVVHDRVLELRALVALVRVFRNNGDRDRERQALEASDNLRATLAKLQGASMQAFLTRPALSG